MTTTINADTTNGVKITSDTSGVLGLQTNGNTAVTIDGSQNVGIGTATPNIGGLTRALTLNTPTGGNYSGVELAGAGTLSARFITNNVGTYIGSQLSIPLVFETNATERARFDSSGNLGIGTASPAVRLHVSNSNGAGSMQLGSNTASQYHYFNFGGSAGGENAWQIGKGDASGAISPSQGFYLYDLKNSTTRLAVDTSGNLLLGSTSLRSSAKLDILGETIALGGNATYYGTIGYNAGTGLMSIASETGGGIRFLSGSTERARINSSGSLLIGTTTGGSDVAKVYIEQATDPAVASYKGLMVRSADSKKWVGAIGVNADGNMTFSQSYEGAGGAYQSLVFYTSNTERARISTGGQTLINATTDAAGSGARLHITGADSQSACSLKIGTNGYPGWYFVNSSGTKVGDIVINSGGTAYNTTSDYRLKNTIAPMTGALAKVAALKPVTYKWNVDGSDGEGFIAHELAEVCPHAVTGEKDAVETYLDIEGNEQTRPKYQGIDTSFLVATLTAAIKEQQALITQLQADVAALKGA